MLLLRSDLEILGLSLHIVTLASLQQWENHLFDQRAVVVFVSELVTLPSFVGFRYTKIRHRINLVGVIPLRSFKLIDRLVRLKLELHHFKQVQLGMSEVLGYE